MGSDSILFQEIHQQPDVIERFAKLEQGPVRKLAARMRDGEHSAGRRRRAEGTSDNAARYAQYLLGANNRLPCNADHAQPLHALSAATDSSPPTPLYLGISQSGQSPDIVSVLAEGRRQGCLTAAITNDRWLSSGRTGRSPGGPGCRRRTVDCGYQDVYTAQLYAIGLLSAHLAGDSEGTIDMLAKGTGSDETDPLR